MPWRNLRMLHSWMGITSNYSLMNEGETYTTEQIRHTEATLNELAVDFWGYFSVWWSSVCQRSTSLQNRILQVKNYDCTFAWMICRLPLKWKVTCVKNIDRWTNELAVLQGQIVIALLLSHATVSKRSVLSLFHHILHINKIAREWSEGEGEKEKREEKKREREREERRRKSEGYKLIVWWLDQS